MIPVVEKYKGITSTWLRWATLDGTLLPTAANQAEQTKAIQIARNLLEMGMETVAVAQATGLPLTQVELL